MTTHRDRILRAQAMLDYYQSGCLIEGGSVDAETLTTMLHDLRHYCARRGIDLERCIALSALHYDAEVNT